MNVFLDFDNLTENENLFKENNISTIKQLTSIHTAEIWNDNCFYIAFINNSIESLEFLMKEKNDIPENITSYAIATGNLFIIEKYELYHYNDIYFLYEYDCFDYFKKYINLDNYKKIFLYILKHYNMYKSDRYIILIKDKFKKKFTTSFMKKIIRHINNTNIHILEKLKMSPISLYYILKNNINTLFIYENCRYSKTLLIYEGITTTKEFIKKSKRNKK